MRQHAGLTTLTEIARPGRVVVVGEMHDVDLVTVLGSLATGRAWVCVGLGECGPRKMTGKPQEGSAPFLTMASPKDGFDASFYVGAITPSKPARGRLKHRS